MRLVKPSNASGQGEASRSEIFFVNNKWGSNAKYRKGRTKNCLVTWRKKRRKNYCSLEIINSFDYIYFIK